MAIATLPDTLVGELVQICGEDHVFTGKSALYNRARVPALGPGRGGGVVGGGALERFLLPLGARAQLLLAPGTLCQHLEQGLLQPLAALDFALQHPRPLLEDADLPQARQRGVEIAELLGRDDLGVRLADLEKG